MFVSWRVMLGKTDWAQISWQSLGPQKNLNSPSRKNLNQIRVPLCPITLPWGGKARHHWGSIRSKCQAATLYGSYANLSNGKWNGTCTSRHRIVGMQLYKWGRQRLTWKDSRTSNVETQIQADANEMKIREGIGLGWSQGFGLD
jgi:hypothetical protein